MAVSQERLFSRDKSVRQREEQKLKLIGNINPPAIMSRSISHVKQMIKDKNPEPFIDMLVQIYKCFPSEENLKKFAERCPDRYVGMMKTMMEIIDMCSDIDKSKMSDFDVFKKLETFNPDKGLIKYIFKQVEIQAEK